LNYRILEILVTEPGAFSSEFSIGVHVRAARKSLRLRQSELAEKIGISNSHLSDIERGALIPTIPTLQKIAHALDRPLEYFLSSNASAPRALATVLNRPSVSDLTATKFGDLIYQKTGGEVSIQFYRHALPSEIYNHVHGLIDGSVDLIIDDLLSFEPYAPLCGVVFLPYFFRDRAHYQRFLNSEIFRTQIYDPLLQSGIRILNPTSKLDYGSFELLFTHQPVFTPDDMAGLRFRSYGSAVADALRRTLGAEPVRVNWIDGEAQMAAGDIDMFLLPAPYYSSLDLHRAARYVTLLDYGYTQNLSIAISEVTYRRLRPNVQQALDEAVIETDQHFSEVMVKRSRDYLKRLPTEYAVPVIHPHPAIWRERYSAALRQVSIELGVLTPELYDALQQL
jgi:TRAP-type C4-dicarboxylate transport system substrate-binding protein